MDTAQSPTSLNLPEQTYITLLISLQYSQLTNLKLPNGKVLDRKDRIEEIIKGLNHVNNLLPQESKATTAEINQLCQELNQLVIQPKTIDRVFDLFQKYLQLERGLGNVPTAKIEEWRKKQAEWQRQKDEALCRQADANSQTFLVIPDYAKLDLEAQFRLINQIKEKVRTVPKNKTWQKLTSAEQEEVLDKVSETVLRDVLQQKEPADEDIIFESIKNLSSQDQQVNEVFSPSEKNQLSLEIANELQLPAVQPVLEQTRQNQEKIQENEIKTAPSREELKKTIKAEFGYTDKQQPELESLVRRIETNWPQNPNPTQTETQGAISKSLRFRDYVQLSAKNITEEAVINNLAPVVKSYYIGTPLVQKQQNLNYQGITFWTAFWSKYTKVNPVVLQNLRRGITPEKLDEEINRFGVNSIRGKKLQILLRQIKDVKKLPWLLQKQIELAQSKAKLFGWLDRINPFGLAFYEALFPKGFNFINARIESLQEIYKHLATETPLGLILTPRLRFFRWRQRLIYNVKLKAYRKYAQIISRKVKNRQRRRFLVALPRNIGNYLSPRWWLGQARTWLAKKTAQAAGKLLIKIGVKLGKDIFVRAGKELIKSGFKQLITKGLAYLLGSALGVTTGGVGTVIAIALAVIDFGIMALKFVFSREGREILKKILEPLAVVATAGLVYLIKLIFSFPFTFIGGALGMIAGPLGAVAGGAIGFVIDSTILPLFRGAASAASSVLAGWSAGAAGPAAAAGGAGLAAGIPAAAAASASTVAAGLLASIGPASFAIIVPAAAFTLALFNIINNNSSLVHVQSAPPLIENPAPGDTAESANFKVQKKANKNTFTNSELASGLKVIYTVTITPKSGVITINNIKDEITVFSKSSPPLPQITLAQNSEDPQGKTISTAASFTYETTLNASYKDSRIKNIITVSVVTAAGLQDKLSAYETINIGSPPSVDCPVSGHISCYSYSNPISANCHHGDNSYENIVCIAYGLGPCCIKIPVFDACKGPTAENKIESSGAVSMCYGKGYNCPDFGKAIDVHAPGGSQVVLPSIGGASVVWNYKSKLGCSVGQGQRFTASSNGHNYEIMICHLNESSPDCTQCPAGSTIGTVHPNAAHIHIELSIDGGYVMPEEFMCQGL